jgi:hypothetical protein
METTTTETFGLFYRAATEYLQEFPKERTPQTYALTKLVQKYKKRMEKLSDELSRKRDDLQSEHCLKDESRKNAFLEDEVKLANGNVIFRKKFDKAGEAACNEAFNKARDEHNAKPFEYEPHYVERPKSSEIDPVYAEAFTGFIFRPFESEQEEENWYLGSNEKAK